eukprot:g55170.t1
MVSSTTKSVVSSSSPSACPSPSAAGPSYSTAQWWAGAGAGVITRCCVAPLDVIKIRLQVGNRGDTPYRGMVTACRIILRQEGLRAFWKGNLAGVLMSAPHTSITMRAFHRAHQSLHPHLHPPVCNFACGAIAGVTATVLTYPMDLIRTTLAVQRQQRVYSSITASALGILQEFGPRGLYRGMCTQILGIMPSMGLQFALFGWFKELFASLEQGATRPASHTSPLISPALPVSPKALAGFLAGMSSKTLAMPFEVVKKRLQTSHFAWSPLAPAPRYRGIMHCVRTVYATEGVTAFWRGTIPNILKAGLSSATTFVAFELIFTTMTARHGEYRSST